MEWNTDGHSPMLSKDAVRAAILAERETAKTMYDRALGGDYSRALAEGMERACCHIEEAMDLPCSFERKHFEPRQTEQAFRVVYRVVHPDRGMLKGLWTTGVYAKREDAERVMSEAGYNGAYIIEEKVQ